MKPLSHADKARRRQQGEFALKLATAMSKRGFEVLRVVVGGLQPRIEVSAQTPPTVREHKGEVALNHITPNGALSHSNRHGCLVICPEVRP